MNQSENILEDLPHTIPYVDPSTYLENKQFSKEYLNYLDITSIFFNCLSDLSDIKDINEYYIKSKKLKIIYVGYTKYLIKILEKKKKNIE